MVSTISGKIVTIRKFYEELHDAYLFGDINASNIKKITHKTYQLCDRFYGSTPKLIDDYMNYLTIQLGVK